MASLCDFYQGSTLFDIRIANLEHNCFCIYHKNVSQAFIVEKIHDKLTVQTNYRPVDIVKDMQVEYGVQISYQKLVQGQSGRLCRNQ